VATPTVAQQVPAATPHVRLRPVRVLFVGDVVRPESVDWLARRLPAMRSEHEVDLTIVDAENCGPDGLSMPVDGVERLVAAGADVITGGNHIFDGPESDAVLTHPRVLRPLNVASTLPGRGVLTVECGDEHVRVVVLADRDALEVAPPVAHMTLEPYAAWSALPPGPATIVEMHATSVTEKMTLAQGLDGEVAAVLGTHMHAPTPELHHLPNGTAFVVDVGMTGARDQRFHGPIGGRPNPAVSSPDATMVLAAVLLDVKNGRTWKISRL
jgi:calcineurin-like phosphoesterase